MTQQHVQMAEIELVAVGGLNRVTAFITNIPNDKLGEVSSLTFPNFLILFINRKSLKRSM